MVGMKRRPWGAPGHRHGDVGWRATVGRQGVGRVAGLPPLTDNMLGGDAQRVGRRDHIPDRHGRSRWSQHPTPRPLDSSRRP